MDGVWGIWIGGGGYSTILRWAENNVATTTVQTAQLT